MKIGELEKNSETIKVVRPHFNRAIFPDATNREGVDALTTLRAGEAGMLRTPSSTPPRWWTMDGDHHFSTKIGTQFVKSSIGASRERSRRTCVIGLWK